MIEFDFDRLVEALPEVKRKKEAQKTVEAVEASTPTPPPASRPKVGEVFTPETLEALLDRVQTQRRPWEAVLEGGEKIRVYPTREQWARERGRKGDGAVEFYAAELRRALPMLKEGYARQFLALKRAFGGELVDWRPPATPTPEPASRAQERREASTAPAPAKAQAKAEPASSPSPAPNPQEVGARSPWDALLAQAEAIGAKLRALRAPILEVDVEGVPLTTFSIREPYEAYVRELLERSRRYIAYPQTAEVYAVWPNGANPLRERVAMATARQEEGPPEPPSRPQEGLEPEDLPF